MLHSLSGGVVSRILQLTTVVDSRLDQLSCYKLMRFDLSELNDRCIASYALLTADDHNQ